MLPPSTAAMKASSPLPPFCFNRKAWQVGLWSIWLSGFLLISVSFYATQLLPSSVKDQIKGSEFRGSPTISICTAPGPFSGSVGSRQALAIRSWLALSSDVTVVLFSQEPAAFSFARGFGTRVLVEPNIDFTFLGTPFFHSMVARSQASGSDISVIIDPEIILFPDFISTLTFAHKLDHDWLLFASSRHVPHFPFHLDEDGKHWLGEDDKQITNKKLQGFLTWAGQWKPCEERILLAWNNGDLPLHAGVLPPFLFRKGLHNHWIINEALSSGLRFVFDASWTVSNFYLNASDNMSPQLFRDSDITKIGNRSWENLGNSHLATLYGSMFFHEANYSNLVKFLKCNGCYLFVNSVVSIVYPMGYQRLLSLGKEMVLESLTQKKILDCVNGFRSVDRTKDCSMKGQLKPSISLSFPFSLEMLLPMLADQNQTIVLAVAGFSYKDMLMSWVCRLRHLVISNFLVFALDHKIYDFAVLQGVPVFKDSLAPTNISFNNCHFGTTCFQKVTKVKSRAVLQILKLGYNVLLSDVDVYWFKNPLPFLFSFGPNILVAQSDEYNKTGPINLPRRLNSGFYFARADGATVSALDKVVKHAAISNLSEQPSFYDTLCGEGGSNRLGNNQCLEPETNLTVHFLDRDLFPNGAYEGLWEDKNVKQTCEEKGCFVLHNNWISGRNKKLERQVFSGLWEYDISSRMCIKSWQKAQLTSYF
ncbi:Fucosylgalactoside 3-alpha-galactosyltransferase [Bertholletia excelsa]